METETKTYYVCSLRVRRELIPLPGTTAYRCVTTAASGPGPDDVILADQVAFEDELIRLELMPPRNPLQAVYARVWRGLDLDKAPIGRRKEPLETLLYRLDSPHRS